MTLINLNNDKLDKNGLSELRAFFKIRTKFSELNLELFLIPMTIATSYVRIGDRSTFVSLILFGKDLQLAEMLFL